MMALAHSDPTRLPAVAAVPVCDGLHAFVELMREEALEQYRHEQILYVQGGMKKAPKVPDILKPQRKRRRPGARMNPRPEKPAFITALEKGE